MGHHIPVSSLAFLVSSSSHTLITFAHFGLIFDTSSNLKHPCLDLAIESKNMQAMYQNLSLVIVDPKIFYSCRFLLCRTSVMLDQTGVLFRVPLCHSDQKRLRYRLQKFGDFPICCIAKWAGGQKLSFNMAAINVSLKKSYKL